MSTFTEFQVTSYEEFHYLWIEESAVYRGQLDEHTVCTKKKMFPNLSEDSAVHINSLITLCHVDRAVLTQASLGKERRTAKALGVFTLHIHAR